tara:strand:- start:6619 stop:7524 length:906 start_codon:yes stop_codon:yes gene_type:complete
MSLSKSKETETANVPSYLEDLYVDASDLGQIAAGADMSVYSGNRVAGLTPAEIEAEAEARRLFGTSMAYDPRTNLMEMIGLDAPSYNPASLLEGNMTAYENRFTNPLINTIVDDFDRVRDMRVQKIQDDAINSGAFGGNRSAIFEQEGTRALDEEMLKTIAGVRESAFDRAMDRLEADTNRIDQSRRIGADLYAQNLDRRSGLLNDLLADQYNLLNLSDDFGTRRRGLDQQLIDADIARFDEERNIPLERLGILAAASGQISPSVIGRTRTSSSKGISLSDIGALLTGIGGLGGSGGGGGS